METKEALTRFLLKCEERGLSPETKRTYHGYLRHFAEEYPELPTDTKIIEAFLRKRKETPKKRGPMFKYLQAFYSYLENFEGVKSPVPPKGKVGRPSKKLVPNLASTEASRLQARSKAKLVQGGFFIILTDLYFDGGGSSELHYTTPPFGFKRKDLRELRIRLLPVHETPPDFTPKAGAD